MDRNFFMYRKPIMDADEAIVDLMYNLESAKGYFDESFYDNLMDMLGNMSNNLDYLYNAFEMAGLI